MAKTDDQGAALSMTYDGDEATPVADLPNKMGIRWFHISVLFSSLLGNVCAASVPGCIPYILRAVEEEYNIDRGTAVLMTSGNAAGSILGVFLFGWLADLIGRRPSMVLSGVLMCVCSMGFFLLPQGTMFWANVGLNAILGVPFGGFLAFVTPYCLEFFPDVFRGRAALLINLGWPVGSTWCIVLVGVLGEANWRQCMAVAMLVPGLSLLAAFFMFMLESPRWLFTVGRRAEGEVVVSKIFASSPLYGGSPKGAAPKVAESRDETQEPPLKLLSELFAKDMLGKTSLACLLSVFTASASFAGWTHAPAILEAISGEEVPRAFFGVTEFAGLFGTLIGGLTLDVLGRKKTLLLAYFLAICAYSLLFTPLATPSSVGYIWLLVGLVQGLMWPALNTYLTEVFPTKLRGTGNGLAAMVGRIANIFAPWVVGSLLTISVYYGLGLLVSFYVMAAIVAALVPQETGGLAMSDGLHEGLEGTS